jgi:hypothetical protein
MTRKLRRLTTSLVLDVFWYCTWIRLESLKLSYYSNLLRGEFQQSGRLQNCITPKPFIVSRHANNRWKDRKVLYNSYIWIQVIFPSEQSQIYTYWLLLTVKSDSASVPKFSFLSFFLWIRGCPPVMVFPRHDVVAILCPWLLFSYDRSHLDASIFEAWFALV